jgi:hypothetical protein
MSDIKLSENEKTIIRRLRNGYDIKTLYPTGKWVSFKGSYYKREDELIHHWKTIDALFNKGLFYASRLTEAAKNIVV